MSDCASEVLFWKEKFADSKKLVRNLQARVHRAPEIQERAVAKALDQLQKDQNVYELVKKGVYTPQARALACSLVTSGCSQDFVGILIQKICRTVGVDVPQRMSRRTVQRAVTEGAITWSQI